MTRTPPWALAAVATLAALGVWAGYAATDAVTRDALGTACLGTATAAGAHAALIGVGRHARRQYGALNAVFRGPGDGALHEWVLGFVLTVPVLLGLAVNDALSVPLVVFMGMLGWLGLTDRRPWTRTVSAGGDAGTPGTVGAVVAAGAALLLALTVPQALAPPVDTDELYWHLAAPAKLLREGALPGGWLDPVSSRPMPLQLVYAALLLVGGTAAVKLFHVLLAGGLLAGLWRTIRAHGGSPVAAAWGVALLAGSWTFLEEVPLAHDNLPAALLVLAAADAALHGRSHRGRFGLAAGAALAVKYTAAPAVAGLVVLHLLVHARETGRQAVADVIGALGVATAIVAPWWVRNLLDGLHPLFPYAGWPDAGVVFAWPEKYGFGRGPLDLLRLPWDLAFRSRTDTFAFLGRLHPAWSLWLPVVLWALVRPAPDPVGAAPVEAGISPVGRRTLAALVVAVGVGVAGWFLGVQWVRHLLPLAPIAAIAWAFAMDRVPRDVARLAFVAWALLLPPQWLDHVVRSADAILVATGHQAREDWLEERVPAWPAVAWVNEHAAADAKIALLFTGEAALVERTVVLGSVEDHTPSRWLVQRGDPLAALREAGVDWVVVQRVGFLRKTYPFLDEAAFQRQFREPEQALAHALVLEGTLVFEDGRHAVWSIAGPPLDDAEAGR